MELVAFRFDSGVVAFQHAVFVGVLAGVAGGEDRVGYPSPGVALRVQFEYFGEFVSFVHVVSYPGVS
ncbi:hypothetical protein RHRU231_450180 [Rhodococcus ruber]|uniref:Uncharacterized protein n=1 Tax=Rhodococcus ruber TaxID=1830 RepID=A0A098BJZ1_9NOCA|nr:hypothetical protein RHRU231_450180 [Rhodococcus ruber]